MRLPTLYETSADGTDLTQYHPTADGNPVFASANGVPNDDPSAYRWTASAGTIGTDTYWLWRGSSSSYPSSCNYSKEVVCVLP